MKVRLHKTRTVLYDFLHNGDIGPKPFCDAAWINSPEPEKNTEDTELKRRWGMGGTKPIESGVEVMPSRSGFGSTLSVAVGTDSFDTNQMKDNIGPKKILIKKRQLP